MFVQRHTLHDHAREGARRGGEVAHVKRKHTRARLDGDGDGDLPMRPRREFLDVDFRHLRLEADRSAGDSGHRHDVEVVAYDAPVKIRLAHEVHVRPLRDQVAGGLGPEEVQARVQEAVDDVNRERSGFEQIKRFLVLPREFDAAQDEVTPTLKLRRKVILEHFAGEVKRLYE